jgi:hypothetical protein
MRKLLYTLLLFIPLVGFGQSNSEKIESLILMTNYNQQEIKTLKENLNIKTRISETHRVGNNIQLLGLIQTSISLYALTETESLKGPRNWIRSAAIGALISSVGLVINLNAKGKIKESKRKNNDRKKYGIWDKNAEIIYEN